MNTEDLASAQRLPRMEELNSNYGVVVDGRGPPLGWTMKSTSVLAMILTSMAIATALYKHWCRRRPGYLEL